MCRKLWTLLFAGQLLKDLSSWYKSVKLKKLLRNRYIEQKMRISSEFDRLYLKDSGQENLLWATHKSDMGTKIKLSRGRQTEKVT